MRIEYFKNSGIQFFEPEAVRKGISLEERIEHHNDPNNGDSILIFALKLFEDEWIPISLDGERNLFRMYIRSLEKNSNSLFAFDTTIRSSKVTHSLHQNNINHAFKFDLDRWGGATEHKNINSPTLPSTYSFTLNDEIKEWIEQIADRKLEQTKKSVKKIIGDSVPNELMQLLNSSTARAAYMQILNRYFKADGAIANIEILVQSDRMAAGEPLNVDLFLDLGNSRTLGMLVETKSNENSMDYLKIRRDSCRELKIIDYQKILNNNGFEKYYEESSHLISSNVQFKPNLFWGKYPETENFKFPTIIRIGDGVERDSNGNTENSNSLSGPKRYLFDKELKDRWWKFDNDDDLEGEILEHVPQDDNDDLLENIARFDQNPLISNPMEPKYPNRTMMIFTLVEYIYQAHCYINSVYYRNICGDIKIRRDLKNIVLSFPTAMPLWERKRFLKQAQKAKEILFRMGVFTDEKINIQLGSDEASCSQISFLYGELERFGTNINHFINLCNYGKTLRLATLDIGGGTTDLSICEYDFTEGSPIVKQRVIYTDGIYTAGDDIVEGIITNLIINNLRKALQSASRTDNFNKFFGTSSKRTETNDRVEIVNKLFYPLALFYMTLTQDSELYSRVKTANITSLNKLKEFITSPDNKSRLSSICHRLERVDKLLGTDEFLVKNEIFITADGDLTIPNLIPDLSQIENEVLRIFDLILDRYSVVINQYSPAFLLLAGKTSSMPIIAKHLKKYISISPDRIIPLTNYPIGEWYPFSDSEGVISDPKTGVAVGNAIGYYSNKQLLDVNIQTDGEESPFTMNFIGYAHSTGPQRKFVANDHIIYKDGSDTQSPVIYNAPVNILYRNIDNERVDSNIIYKIALKNKYQTIDRLKLHLDFSSSKNEIKIASVEGDVKDESGNTYTVNDDIETFINFKKTTMFNDSYYLDSGQFQLDSVN